MTVIEWTAVVLSIIGILTAVFSSMRYIIKSIMRELTPNGGSSLRDQINSTKEQVSRIETRLDSLYDHLLK
jgi:hypothetical protein